MSTNFALGSIGATALPLGGSNTKYESVIIKALSTNTDKVYVGGSAVTTANGLELSAGEAITLGREFGGDLANIYCIGGAAGQEVRVLAA